MTNKEIKKHKQELYDIQKIPEIAKQLEPLKDLAKRIGASIPHIKVDRPMVIQQTKGNDTSIIPSFTTRPLEDEQLVNEIIRNIHMTLQTEEMFNACVTSKRACWWACVAAIVACISVFLQNWPWFLSILFLLRGKLKL